MHYSGETIPFPADKIILSPADALSFGFPIFEILCCLGV